MSPAPAVRNGIAYIPDERKAQGLFPSTATLFNLSADQRTALWNLATSRGAGDWRNFYLQNARITYMKKEVDLLFCIDPILQTVFS